MVKDKAAKNSIITTVLFYVVAICAGFQLMFYKGSATLSMITLTGIISIRAFWGIIREKPRNFPALAGIVEGFIFTAFFLLATAYIKKVIY